MRNMDIHPTQAVLPDKTIMTGNVFQRNIICFRDPKSMAFRFNDVNFEHNTWDGNLFYHFGLPVVTGFVKAQGSSGPNLAPDPGFEEGEAGAMPKEWTWYTRPIPTLKAIATDQGPHSGGRALRIEGGTRKDAASWERWPVVKSMDVPAKPGQAYKLTVWMRAEKAGAQASLGAKAWKANTYDWSKDAKVSVGTEWKEYEVCFTFPGENDPNYRPELKAFYLRVGLREESGALWVDDVCLKEATALSEWESWQAMGQDVHSLVADPLFVDPEKDDYRLRPESPAFKLGFKPIPVEKIGPYNDPLRASWPIVEAEGARERPLTSARKVQ